MRQAPTLAERAVFLSASIPDPRRWSGSFDALEITDAVSTAARAILTASGTLVSAAHPTIAPLLLYVAGEFPKSSEPRVIIYQSHLFDPILPPATLRFENAGIGVLRWTDAVEGDTPEPGRRDASLQLMRETMLRETDPAGAIFIGGMEGIAIEHDMFQELYPGRPEYALGRPGGEARYLAERADSPLGRELMTGDVYPAVLRRIVADISTSLE
jgi:hypothetical protein